MIIYSCIISAEVGWESEKKKATRIIFDASLKRKTGKEKVRVTTAIMLYENDKLDEEDVLETFHHSEVHNWPLLISSS